MELLALNRGTPFPPIPAHGRAVHGRLENVVCIAWILWVMKTELGLYQGYTRVILGLY